jgi:hypothetical protein
MMPLIENGLGIDNRSTVEMGRRHSAFLFKLALDDSVDNDN